MGLFSNIGDFFFGDDPEVPTPQDLRIKNLSTPGFTTSQSGGSLNFKRTKAVDDLLAGFRGFSTGAASDIRGLRDQVVPGFGALTDVRRQANENARDRAISNLGANLRRRRVAGSSFGNTAMTQAELAFGQEDQKIRAESKLQELAMTQQLIDRELQISTGAITTELNQMLNEGKIAANLTGVAQQAASNYTQVLNDAAQAQARLRTAQIEGVGKMIGQVAGFATGGGISPAMSDLSKAGSTASNWASGLFDSGLPQGF
jgi:hypothetical protein